MPKRAKLRGKIREIYGTEKAFAKALGIDLSTLNLKLNKHRNFLEREVLKIKKLLGLKNQDVYSYFFSDDE